MRRIFLHFINRELHDALSIKADFSLYHFVCRLVSVFSCGPMLCNISQVYEFLYGQTAFVEEILFLSRFGLLELDASHASFDEFAETRRSYYRHDLERYPMYSAHGADKVFAGAALTRLPHSETTTQRIHREILGAIHFDYSPPPGLSALELNALRRIGTPIEQVLNRRDDAGLTFALFPSRGLTFDSAQERMALRRALTAAYIRHYVEFRATLVTDIPFLTYYDQLSPDPSVGRAFPFMQRMANATGIASYLRGLPDWGRTTRVESWNSEAHNLFGKSFEGLCAGLDTAYRESNSTVNHVAWAWSKVLPHLGSRANWLDSYENLLFETIYRINSANQVLGRDLPGFQKGCLMHSSSSSTSTRVLIMTASDMEDVAFETVVRSFALKRTDQIRGRNIITEYHGIPGIRLFQVRSSGGSIGPAGADLVGLDAILKVQPQYVVACGICFGMDQTKRKVGDIILSEQVVIYDHARVQEKPGQPDYIIRGGTLYGGVTLLDRARFVKRNWTRSGVVAGRVCSGSKLVDSESFKKFLLTVEPEAIAGEMESAGIFSAADREKVEALMVKAISDWGEEKSDESQRMAANNAFSFAMEIVSKL